MTPMPLVDFHFPMVGSSLDEGENAFLGNDGIELQSSGRDGGDPIASSRIEKS
jgi:hypothetical protein